MFAASPALTAQAETEDGLMVSAAPVQVIELPVRDSFASSGARRRQRRAGAVPQTLAELGWLSQPLSGRNLVWTINVL